jgi:hypothetical protein
MAILYEVDGIHQFFPVRGFEGFMIAIRCHLRPLASQKAQRPNLFYCYFRSPQKFLENFAMEQSSYLFCILGMLAYF